jgi:hypothetical protein
MVAAAPGGVSEFDDRPRCPGCDSLALAGQVTCGRTKCFRIVAHQARVQQELLALGSTRGVPRPVYRSDGEWFETVSAAARATEGAKPDCVCQAIKRGGCCRGWRWCYADDIPADFFDDYIKAHPGLACAWPWPRGGRVAAYVAPQLESARAQEVA